MTHHPFRDAALHVYQGIGAAEGRFVAMFHPYSGYPIRFSGSTADEVVAKAEAFRDDAIAKHEASFIARSEALAKAREAREAKKAEAAQ